MSRTRGVALQQPTMRAPFFMRSLGPAFVLHNLAHSLCGGFCENSAHMHNLSGSTPCCSSFQLCQPQRRITDHCHATTRLLSPLDPVPCCWGPIVMEHKWAREKAWFCLPCGDYSPACPERPGRAPWPLGSPSSPTIGTHQPYRRLQRCKAHHQSIRLGPLRPKYHSYPLPARVGRVRGRMHTQHDNIQRPLCAGLARMHQRGRQCSAALPACFRMGRISSTSALTPRVVQLRV